MESYREERRPLAPGQQVYSYRVEEMVGTGGSALTYRASHGPWKWKVALKEFFPVGATRDGETITFTGSAASYERAKVRFWREAQTLRRFCHPGIVRALHCFEANNTAYLTQEFLSGSPVNRLKPSNVESLLALLQAIGEALMVIHAGGLIHGDIKPANLFYTDERYLILDFGASRKFNETFDFLSYSPGYSPPELHQKSQTLSPATDVYSLCATVYSLLCNKKPPDAQERLEGALVPSLNSIRPDLSDRFTQALDRGMALDPADRQEDVVLLLQEIGLSGPGKLHLPTVAGIQQLGETEAHRGGVFCMQLDTNQRYLWSTGRDGFLRQWSWPDLRETERSLFLSDHTINCLCILGGSLAMLVGTQAGSLHLILPDEAINHLIIESGPAVTGIAEDKQGGAYISLGNGQVAHYSILGEVHSWEAHLSAASCVRLSTNNEKIATGAEDGMIHLWSRGTLEYQTTLTGHTKAIRGLVFSPDDKILVSCSNDFSCRVWYLARQKEIRELRDHRAMVWDNQFTSNPDKLATTCADRHLRYFSLESSRLLQRVEAHELWCRPLIAPLNTGVVATGGGDGKIKLWNL